MDGKDENSNFLQSEEWRRFQEAAGRKTFRLEAAGFSASIIEHSLLIVGRYLYIPRGPVFSNHKTQTTQEDKQITNHEIQKFFIEIANLAKEENAGWIRFDPASEKILSEIKTFGNPVSKIAKAPHDMQPREIFVIDITKSEEELLAEMKPKTRYNIGIAGKKGVSLRITNRYECTNKNQYVEEFLRLTGEMAKRQGIGAHPEEYYRKMIEALPPEMLKIYVAEYEGKVIAANLMLFYGDTATYLHGASGNEHRNVMAPFLLQWQAILDAKKAGFAKYDFGGISTNYESDTNVRITNKWAGITKFKLGFSPNTKSVVFPGSYDIVINPWKYGLYRGLQKVKAWAYGLRR